MSVSNKRLLTAAELLGQTNSVADIGTDHAFLPIHLVREGIAQKVIACDIAEGPLSVAKANTPAQVIRESATTKSALISMFLVRFFISLLRLL